MIHHYINLVCWRAMYEMYDPVRDRVWVDSVSMSILARLFRCDAAYRPGTSVLDRFGPRSGFPRPWFFFPARLLNGLSPKAQMALPFLADGHEHELPLEITHAIEGLNTGTRIGIGVSSPKQNRIAANLFYIRPDLEYHCLGAALFAMEESTPESRGGLFRSGSGLEWVRFLIANPQRTIPKIWVTFSEVIRVLAVPSSRRRFRMFLEICEVRC